MNPRFTSIVEGLVNSSKYDHINGKKSLFEKFILPVLKKIFNLCFKNISFKTSLNNSGSFLELVSILFFIIFSVVLIFIFIRKKNMKAKNVNIFGEDINEKTSSFSLKETAIKYEKDGNYEESIRYFFIAILYEFNKKNISPMDESKTNFEILNDLNKKDFDKIKEFTNVADMFYKVWYGKKKVTQAEFESVKCQFDVLFLEVLTKHEKNK